MRLNICNAQGTNESVSLNITTSLTGHVRVGIGIGTPQRLLDLLSKDALKVTHLKRIVIDASYLDQKQRSIFDMKELLDPLLKLLSHHAISDRIVTEVAGIKVLAF